MIKAEIHYIDNSYYIKVNGHADYAPKGYDIVCAGVSALTSAFYGALFAASVQDYCHSFKVVTDDGEFCVFIDRIKNKCADETVRSLLLMLGAGLDVIERQYPAHLKLNVFDLPERDNDNDTSEQTMNSVREEDKG